MNFHKTIGFLAALLLTLGLGVPDSYAQNTIPVDLNVEAVVEGAGAQDVAVTVTLNAAPGAGNTLEVTVTPSADGDPVTVSIADDNTNGTGTLSLSPSEDPDAVDGTITVTASATDYTDGTANLTVTDDDGITLTFAPDSVVEGTGAQDVVVTVTLSAAANEAAAAVVTVSLIADFNGVQVALGEATINDGETAGTATLSITPPAQDDQMAERSIRVTATATSYVTETTNLPVRDARSLTLNVEPTEVREEGGAQDVTVTVTLNAAPGTGTTVEVTVTPSALGDPVTVTIADTATDGTGTLSLTPLEDADADNETITVTATAMGYTSDTETVTVTDDETGTISLMVDPTSLREEGGAQDVTVSVRLSDATAADLPVIVTAELVGIPLAETTVTVTGTDNTGDGLTASGMLSITSNQDPDLSDKTVTVTATSGDYGAGMATLTLVDTDRGTIALTAAPTSVMEGATTDVVVTITTSDPAASDSAPVMVTLTPSDYGDPVTVTIAATGTGTVSLSPPEDPDADDGEITVTASATRYIDATATVTITDDDATGPQVTITTSTSEIRENVGARDVVVTATLEAQAPADGVTVHVTAEGQIEPVDGQTYPVQIVIPAGSMSNSVTIKINPSDDNVFTTRTIQVTGRADGYRSGSAEIAVLDNDATIGSISVSSDPPSLTKDGGAQTVTLTVHVVGQPETPAGTTVVVNLATADGRGTLGANSVNVVLGNHPDQDPATYPTQSNDSHGVGTAGTTTLSFTADEVNEGGTVNVTASAEMYESGTDAIPIRDRDGADVQGYRLVLVKPAEGGWANDGNDQVIVDVIRVGNVAYPWTDFQSIKVSVRDTAHDNSDPAHEIDWVMASNFNLEDNGAVTFDEVHTGNSRGDVIWRGNNTIRFEIQIHHCNGGSGNNAGGARDAGECGSAEPSSNGQYLGAYVTAEFSVGSGTPSSLSNRDSDKPVYPSNPTLVDEANRYVGDGKLFKVDNLDPSNAAVAFVNVTDADGEAITSNSNVKVGDEVRVAVAVSGDVLFRESGMRIQIQPKDITGTYKGRSLPPQPIGRDADLTAPVTRTINFSASQVITASNDSLRTSWNIGEGFFTYKADDFIDFIGPRGTVFEADNTIGRVLVAVKDQANNWSNAVVKTFNADSRSPGVTIRYPAADPDSIYDHTHSLRFTGDTVDEVYGSEFLNPLVIEVDEDLSKLEVFAVGADTLDISDQFSFRVGDSTSVYDTSELSSPKKDGEGDDDKYPGKKFVPSYANIAGTDIELAVLATDLKGNTAKVTLPGVTHDAARPEIEDWFPKTDLLDDNQFNDATPPVFTLPEDVDSIAVRFTASGGNDVIKERGGVTTKGDDSIDFSGALTDEVRYNMTIFVRDLAGNVYITPEGPSSNMRFNAEFDNPLANDFSITNMNGVTETNETAVDSVIAGQALILEIQAEDYDAGSDSDRPALTYKNMARISAWDTDGGAAESVWFEGTGVTDDADNPDGVAMLNAADWRIGKRTVTVKSNKATGFIKILVQHLDSGMGDTAVVGFDGAIDSLYVGAADFAGFEITAWEEGVEGEAPEIWGDYTLRVVPTDRHGNPSVRAFKADFDSLDVLDTRVGDNALEYKNGIDVEIIGVPAIEDFALLILSIEKEGATYDLVAPDNRRSQTVQIRVVNASLMDGDDRSQNIRSTEKFTISAPLEPVLTLWVDGVEGDQAGNDVLVPAEVTVRAEGFNEGDMVTFTRNGTAGDPVAADDDGNASLMITASVASTTTVSASNGVYSTDELTITFVDAPAEPARKSYVDANGAPVYLISDSDMTVGVDDFLALVAAFGSSDGDDNYNAQADVDDDGDVDVDDFVEFIGSFGRTATGPATKPIVLLPGINENAEFSLSLGSERVVAGELVAVDVSLANVAALVGYGFALNYETDNFEFISVAPADEDLLKSTGGETLFHHIVSDGQITVANGLFNGTAVSGGGDAVRFVFRVLREFEDNARFEIANGLVFDPGQLQNPAVVAGVLELQSTPREFALHQNFPNPFNPDTTIKYDLAESADVTLQIYNVLGQVVRTLVASEAQNAGRYQIRWNGMDDRGVPVSSGIYFYQISADGMFSDVRKLMLLK